MKLTLVLVPLLAPALALGGSGDILESLHSDPHSTAGPWECHRVDAHAPTGVMAGHTHNAGEWMLSYRYMWMRMEGMGDGTGSLSTAEIFALGYPVAPTDMEMEMHMIGLMYAPTDSLTLMAMANYQERQMDHLTLPGSMPAATMGPQFRRRSEGWGDLSLGGLYKVYDANGQRAHLELGVSVPSDDFNELAYPMQTTSGTWDLLAGATWLWQSDRFSGGAQARVRLPLNDNTHGYSYGDKVTGTTWASVFLTEWASLSGRLALEWRNDIDGVDERIGAIMAPPMEADNHGGTWLEGGFGLNLVIPGGLEGHHLAAEVLFPLYQDLNGPQLERDWMMVLGWQKAF